MSFEKFVLPELEDLAREILKYHGEEFLANFDFLPPMCGCMGPSPGEYLCPCAQRMALKSNLVEVINEFDPVLAKKIWLRRFVATLPG